MVRWTVACEAARGLVESEWFLRVRVFCGFEFNVLPCAFALKRRLCVESLGWWRGVMSQVSCLRGCVVLNTAGMILQGSLSLARTVRSAFYAVRVVFSRSARY
ncbi:hypothetical protein TPADAL_0861a [Treponema pallidum subsp. pallidum DAL-1]|nr:hypothetical protein TPADAL_0861a [Treponema pallidum subsp. pallidum DAL-1]